MATPLSTTASMAASEATAALTPDLIKPSSPDLSQRYCLKWNNYQSNVTSTFKELLAVEDFVDITLMAEGGALRAHKVVLSACSPYFRDILKGIAAWQHPVIVLKDVPYSHLQGIVEFIYHGEVSVDQNSLDSFLKAAQLLRVKGLTDEAILNNSDGSGNNNKRMSMLPARTHLHHPRKSLRPTRAIIKRDLVQSEGFACKEETEDEGSSPHKRLATSSSLSFDEESNLIINENNQSPDNLKQHQHRITEVDCLEDEDEEEEIDDVEEDEELESGDEEEEEVPPFFSHSQNKSNNVRGQSDWDQSDERKQRQQIMMGGGDLSIVPVGIDPKYFDPSYAKNFLEDLTSGATPSTSCEGGPPGSTSAAGQKKTCPHCNQQLSWHALSRHVRDMHRNKTGYVTCKFCFKMFRNKNSLGCHMWRFHKDAKDQQGGLGGGQRGETPPTRNDDLVGSIPMMN